jgi:putative transposase
MSDEKPMGQVIQIDEARIRDHLGEMVRVTVEETLNALLDAEADQLCGAGRYERSQARQDTRAGSYERTLQTTAGEANLKVPKLRRQTFETAIIERSRMVSPASIWQQLGYATSPEPHGRPSAT